MRVILVIWDVSKTAVKRDAADSVVLWLSNQLLTQPAKFHFFGLTPTGQGKVGLKMTRFFEQRCDDPRGMGACAPLGYGWWCRGTNADLTLPVALGNPGGEQGEGSACVLLLHIGSVSETESDLAGRACF